MRKCPKCGNQVSENAIFCDQCGTKLPSVQAPVQEPVEPVVVEQPAGGVPEGIVICPGCGAENVPGEIFCDVCGEPLETPEPVEVEAALPDEAESVEVTPEEVIEEAGDEIEAEEALVEETLVEEPLIEETLVEETLVEEEPGDEVYCSVCGSPVQAGDTFCGSCGAALTAAEFEEAPILEDDLVEQEAGLEDIDLVQEVIEEEPVIEAPVVVEAPVIEEPVIEEPVVVEEPVVEEPVIEEALVVEEPVVVEALTCSVCGASVTAGQAFCASCGAALQAQEPLVEVEPEVVAAAGPYLEIVESGAHIPLVAQPELLVGRFDEASGIEPEVDMTPHGGLDAGVSRRHALLLYEGDAWLVMDLDSTNGTFVNGQELAPKTRTPLNDGDKIEFGEAEAVFHAG